MIQFRGYNTAIVFTGPRAGIVNSHSWQKSFQECLLVGHKDNSTRYYENNNVAFGFNHRKMRSRAWSRRDTISFTRFSSTTPMDQRKYNWQ